MYSTRSCLRTSLLSDRTAGQERRGVQSMHEEGALARSRTFTQGISIGVITVLLFILLALVQVIDNLGLTNRRNTRKTHTKGLKVRRLPVRGASPNYYCLSVSSPHSSLVSHAVPCRYGRMTDYGIPAPTKHSIMAGGFWVPG
jgi:hypothetical protein